MNYKFDDINKTIIKKAFSLDRYLRIQELFKEGNIINSEEFQRTFNGFYRVRRKLDWREKFYKVFDEHKTDRNPNFDKILDELYDCTNTVEPVFVSKMVATIDPKMPILDQYVCKNLGLDTKLKGKSNEEKLEVAKKKYRCLIEIEKDLLKNNDALKHTISEIKKYLGNEITDKITDEKILDFLLWISRD